MDTRAGEQRGRLLWVVGVLQRTLRLASRHYNRRFSNFYRLKVESKFPHETGGFPQESHRYFHRNAPPDKPDAQPSDRDCRTATSTMLHSWQFVRCSNSSLENSGPVSFKSSNRRSSVRWSFKELSSSYKKETTFVTPNLQKVCRIFYLPCGDALYSIVISYPWCRSAV
jgi:hypothetical protein